MFRFIIVLFVVLLISACDQRQPASTDVAQDKAASTGGKSASRTPRILPSGFSLPFQHHVRASRQEKLGGAIKHRVVIEIRGLSLEEADQMLAEAVAKSGYSRGEKVVRDGGFIVPYNTESGEKIQTSFFSGHGGAQFKSADATGILHVTWINRG